jgi:hypothetical protein
MRPFLGSEEKAHAVLGTLVLVCGLLQVIAGVLRPKPVRPVKHSALFAAPRPCKIAAGCRYRICERRWPQLCTRAAVLPLQEHKRRHWWAALHHMNGRLVIVIVVVRVRHLTPLYTMLCHAIFTCHVVTRSAAVSSQSL